ncbi:MAG TPA: hypothetical protein VG370_19085 [Chloroflexota bacterium]|nr:hypothetical protein [Chloroflexota bacterium]
MADERAGGEAARDQVVELGRRPTATVPSRLALEGAQQADLARWSSGARSGGAVAVAAGRDGVEAPSPRSRPARAPACRALQGASSPDRPDAPT